MDTHQDIIQAEKDITSLIRKYTVDLTEKLTLDTEEDFVYLSDPESYDLYHISISAGSSIPAGWHDYQGKKCYEVLQQRDAPCPFCTNHLLRLDKYYIWEHCNALTGKNYVLKDKLVMLHGKPVRLEVVIDVSSHAHTKAVLKNSLESESVLINCIEALVTEQDTMEALRRIVQNVGEFYRAERAYLHCFDYYGEQIGHALRWRAFGEDASHSPILEHPNPEIVKVWEEVFRNGRQTIVRDVEKLRDSDPQVYSRLQKHGVRSLCFTSLYMDDRLAGLVCLHNIEAHWGELHVLNLLAKYIAGQMQKAAVEHENHRITHDDPVTGYQNFESFKKQVQEILARNPDMPYTLWYCDLRNFKYINDVFGYDVGNRILRYWANLIASVLEPEEAFARISADNFTALHHYHGQAHIEQLFQRIVAGLADFHENERQRFPLEVVSGVYVLEKPMDRLSIEEMLNRANMAQKSVKNQTGSQVAVYSHEMRARVLCDMEMQSEMREAMRNEEFVLYLQPQVALTPEGRQGPDFAEALVRWRKSDQQLIMPGAFIGLFERNGMIVDLDLYVFAHACRYVRDMRGKRPRPLCIAVNVSRISMLQPDFVERYCSIKKQYDIQPGEIELEFTESIAVENYERFREIVSTMGAEGFGCAMDDFGTGQSSLNVLKNLPINILKLDREFFEPTADPARGWAVISSVLELAHKLDMHTVAEGIESAEQVTRLRDMGCKYIQGYIFSKPLPLADFERFDWMQA